MEFRQVGSTGIEVGIIGVGGEHVDNQPREVVEELIGAAIDNANMNDAARLFSM